MRSAVFEPRMGCPRRRRFTVRGSLPLSTLTARMPAASRKSLGRGFVELIDGSTVHRLGRRRLCHAAGASRDTAAHAPVQLSKTALLQLDGAADAEFAPRNGAVERPPTECDADAGNIAQGEPSPSVWCNGEVLGPDWVQHLHEKYRILLFPTPSFLLGKDSLEELGCVLNPLSERAAKPRAAKRPAARSVGP
jgi:hypothetical protein